MCLVMISHFTGISLPNCLEISAWTDEGEIMGLRHRKYKMEGVQFHPCSFSVKEANFMDNLLSILDSYQKR